VVSRPGSFTPWNDLVTFVQEAGWVRGPVWTGAEKLAPTGIQSPDHPASSELLYRLHVVLIFKGNFTFNWSYDALTCGTAHGM